MIGLRTGRVVVIDDRFEEARPLIEGLGRLGLPIVYCSGQPGEVPPEPLRGVRLVFLDLHLVEVGDIRSILLATIGILPSIVDTSEKGVGIVYWTKHPTSEQEQFETLLKERLPDFRPAFVAPQEKVKYISDDTPDLLALFKEIEQGLEGMPGYRVSLEWEQFVHDAASRATSLLHGLVASDDELLKVQASMSRACRGREVSEADALSGFFETVNEVLLDHMQPSIVRMPTGQAHISALRRKVTEGEALPHVQRAEINRILLASEVETPKPWTGNVYVRDQWNDDGPEFPIPVDPTLVRSCLYEMYRFPGDAKTDRNGARRWREQLHLVAKESKPCVLEISPACDYAQNKVRMARLLGGLLIRLPSDGVEDIAPAGTLQLPAESRAFAKELFFIVLDLPSLGLQGQYLLTLNARHLATLPASAIAKVRPVLRLRHGVMVDVQAWFAGHAARPGYLAIV